MNQSQNSIAMLDQSITSLDYNSTFQHPHHVTQGPFSSGWNSAGPTSLQEHSYYTSNDNNSFYQSRCISQKEIGDKIR